MEPVGESPTQGGRPSTLESKSQSSGATPAAERLQEKEAEKAKANPPTQLIVIPNEPREHKRETPTLCKQADKLIWIQFLCCRMISSRHFSRRK